MGTTRFSSKLGPGDYDFLATQPHGWLEAAKKNRRAASLLGAAALADMRAKFAYITAYGSAGPDDRLRMQGQHPDEPELDGPTFFFYALALENLIKGTLVARKTAVVKDGKLAHPLNSHDLPLLAEKAGLKLNADELAVLQIVTSCGTSWGRYPVASSAAATAPGCRYELADIIGRLERLYARFADALEAARKRDEPVR